MAFIENGPNDSIDDANGNELIKFAGTASAVNGLRVVNSATGNNPILTNEGEADTGMTFAGYDGTNTEEILILDAVASAINELTVTSAATAGKPKISATGGDTNISLELVPKGTGGIAIGSGGTPIAKVLSGTATVDLASIADGDDLSANVTVIGAAVGDPCFAGLTTLTTEDVLISAKVSAADTVEVTFLNRNGGAVDLASGTLRAVVMKF